MGYTLAPHKIKEPIIGFHPLDEAMKECFTFTLYADLDKKLEAIKVVPVTGPPIRELGTQMAMNPLLEGDKKKRLNQTVALPASALSKLNFFFNPQYWSKANFRKLGWSEEGNKVYQSTFPLPIVMFYQFDMWTKFRSQMNQWLRLFMLKFINREISLSVNFGGPWENVNIPVFLKSGPEDITGLDLGDNDREIKFAARLSVDAWVFPDPYMIPTVKKLVQKAYIGDMAAAYPQELEEFENWLYAQ